MGEERVFACLKALAEESLEVFRRLGLEPAEIGIQAAQEGSLSLDGNGTLTTLVFITVQEEML